jgi:hypothetical protein
MTFEEINQFRNIVRAYLIVVLQQNKVLARCCLDNLIEVDRDSDCRRILAKSKRPGVMALNYLGDDSAVHSVVGNDKLNHGIILGLDHRQNIGEVIQPLVHRDTDRD